MSNPLPDHYAVLGIKPGATQDEIKRRYRELARQYHPDVNPSPDAAHKIKSVNEAHRILGDADRRSRYDAEFALNPPKPPPANARAKGGASAANTGNRSGPSASDGGSRRDSSRTGPGPGSRPFFRHTAPASAPRPTSPDSSTQKAAGSSAPKVEFNGFGRTYAEPGSSGRDDSRAQAQHRADTNRARESARATATALVSRAEVAFLTRNYSEAERLCKEALSRDRTIASAHEMLGDIYAVRGRVEAAIEAYSYAVQFNPQNYSIQGKLDRLIGRGPDSGSRRVTTNGRKGVSGRGRSGASRVSREAAMLMISLALFAGGCGAIAAFAQNPGVPIGSVFPWVTSLSPNLIITLGVEGMVGGVLLAFYGRLRPLAEEVTDRSLSASARSAPLMPILALFSIVWFYASLMVYVALTVRRNRFSMSMVRLYSLTLALVAFITVVASMKEGGAVGWLETAAFSGNVVFPSALVGWFLGDCVRLRVR